MKKCIMRLSSRLVLRGMPSKQASRQRTMARSIMSTARRTGERISWMIPVTVDGNLLNQVSQWDVLERVDMSDTVPTNATIISKLGQLLS